MTIRYGFIAAILLAATFTSGCSFLKPIACDAETQVADAGAKAIAETCDCDNTSQIAQDLLTKLDKLDACKVQDQITQEKYIQEKGAIGHSLCPVLMTEVMQKICSTLPSPWECHGPDNTQALTKAIAFCEANIPF
jgi:hypothetical protein